MKKITIVVIAAGALLAAAAFSGVGRPEVAQGQTGSSGGVNVSGHGVVVGVPDKASLTFGVQTAAGTAAAALGANSERMAKVVARLKELGAEDLRTEQVSLSPRQRPDGTVSGYEAQNTVSAATAVAKAGTLIDAAVAAGANTIGGPSLSLSDRDARYRDALKRAVEDAKRKATALAEAGGFAVGAVTAVQESGATPVPIYDTAAAGAKAATPVEPGKLEVTADVLVTFAIR